MSQSRENHGAPILAEKRSRERVVDAAFLSPCDSSWWEDRTPACLWRLPARLTHAPVLRWVPRRDRYVCRNAHAHAHAHTHTHALFLWQEGLGNLNVESRVKFWKNFIILEIFRLRVRISKTWINNGIPLLNTKYNETVAKNPKHTLTIVIQ